jgi:hypothetical protein
MLRYRNELFIGCYADPEALPEVHELPALLDAELQALAHRRASRPGLNGNPSHAQPVR